LIGAIFAWLIGVIIFFTGDVPKIVTIMSYTIGILLCWFVASYSIKSNRAKA